MATIPRETNAAPTQVRMPLRDGRRIVVRPVRPTDLAAVARFADELGPEHRRLRFMHGMPAVPPELVMRLVDVDHDDHVAWIAVCGERVIGEGRAVRSPDTPSEAEIAFSVVGDWHRLGIARLLVDVLAVISASQGIDTFTANLDAGNHRSAALLRSIGLRLSWDGGELAAHGPVPAGHLDLRQRARVLAAHDEAARRSIVLPHLTAA